MKKWTRRMSCHLLLVAVLAAPASGPAIAGLSQQPPAKLAQRLYDAWHAHARTAALKVADRQTVDKLFGVRWHAMKFAGCNARDEGGFECIYKDAAGDFSLAMIVDGGASLGGYNVASVSFSSEE